MSKFAGVHMVVSVVSVALCVCGCSQRLTDPVLPFANPKSLHPTAGPAQGPHHWGDPAHP